MVSSEMGPVRRFPVVSFGIYHHKGTRRGFESLECEVRRRLTRY